ncbi:MAG: uL15 family ribosomal protein [Bacilli bacterium]|nr:uL15 family ribosomal protein [Bacilli bacterium]
MFLDVVDPFLTLAGSSVDAPLVVLYVLIGLTLLILIVCVVVWFVKKRQKNVALKEESKPLEEEKGPEAIASVEEEASEEAAEILEEEEVAKEDLDEVAEEEKAAGMEILETKINDDGDEILVEKDKKGNIFEIRFIKSFTAKLIQSPEETKKYYEELKNEVLSYKKANSRVSWHYDSVNVGREKVLKFVIRGKTLCVYYALNADDYAESKYKVEKVEKKKYEDVPCLYRIKNDRRRDYAKDLIATVMGKLGLEKGEEQHESYVLPYEETSPLLKRGLIKELKVQVNKPAPAPVEEAPEEELEILETKTNADGDEILVEKDAKGNIFEIRFVKSFTAKIIQAPEETKKYYEELKNEALSYKKNNSRVSWHYDSINAGRNRFLKFAVRGKTLCVYYPLNADDYAETKYKVEKVESKKFEEVPCLFRIKNDRRLGYAKDLMAEVAKKLGLEKGKEQHESYILPYEENKPLIKRGLIKELKVKVNKPEAAIEEAPADMEILETKTNADGDEILVEKDAKGNIFEIRYIKSFKAKLSQSEATVKDYYTILKNYALSYKKVNSRVSWRYDSLNLGRNQVLKFAIRGKTLCVYYALNADDYAETKYKVEKVESKKFEEVPCLFRIKNDRRLGYAKDLIDDVMKKFEAGKGKEQDEDYRIPTESTKALLKKGLIKELKTRVKEEHQDEHHTPISVEEADKMMTNEVAEASIEEDVIHHHHKGKKEIINIDTLSQNFKDGDMVDLKALIKKKLVPAKTGYVKVLARGVLDKRLIVDLDDYSLQAVKMIILLGGHAKKIQ